MSGEQKWTIARRERFDIYSNSVRVATCEHQGAAEAVVAAFKAQDLLERYRAALEKAIRSHENLVEFALPERYKEEGRQIIEELWAALHGEQADGEVKGE